jgi:hypothetical protein
MDPQADAAPAGAAPLSAATDFVAFAAAVGRELGTSLPAVLLPLARDWRRRTPSLWSSGGVDEEYLLQGARRHVAERAPADYGLLGFFGHGVNSHAFYLGFRLRRVLVHLRWHFGGAYATRDEQRARIARDLPTVAAVVSEALADEATLTIIDVMGEGEVLRTVRGGAPSPLTLDRFYAAAPRNPQCNHKGNS